MGSREEILARIRRAKQHGGATPSKAERQMIESYLAAHPRGPAPNFDADHLSRFIERAQLSTTSVDRVEAMTAVPAAVARYLRDQALPLQGCVSPALAQMDWAAAGLQLEARAARDADLVGVTGVFCALAETATLMMVSGAQTPATNSLLPETHIAIVPLSRLVRTMEDGWDLLRAELGEPPRAVNFISGPSRTGDIEQTIILGAHGPYRVHVILVG